MMERVLMVMERERELAKVDAKSGVYIPMAAGDAESYVSDATHSMDMRELPISHRET
jgi:hypothetical protein